MTVLKERKFFINKPPRKQVINVEPAHPTGKGYSTFFFNLLEESEIEYWSYKESRDFLRPLMFSSKKDYKNYSYHSYQQRRYGGDDYVNNNGITCPVKPAEIPDDIVRFYKDEWVSDFDFFLGHAIGDTIYFPKTPRGSERVPYYTYEAACKYMRTLNIETIEDYMYWESQSRRSRYIKNGFIIELPSGKIIPTRPALLPILPQNLYHKDWVCIEEYIGMPYTKRTMTRRKPSGISHFDTPFQSKDYLTYEEAREWLHACKFSSRIEFIRYQAHKESAPFVTKSGHVLPPYPDFLPPRPKEHYSRVSKIKYTWKSWYDLLGIPFNKNHDAELEELINKSNHIYYRSFFEWERENQIRNQGYSLHSYVRRKILSGEWVGWKSALNRYQCTTKCSFDDAKILLSFKGLTSIAKYNEWRRNVGSPFFLPVIIDDEYLPEVYPDELNATVSNFLSLDLGDKVETQARATPVLAITVLKDQNILVHVVKPGKFEAFILYHNKPNVYVFDFYDKNIWEQLLRIHCEHLYGGNVFHVKHLGILYQDLANNFRRMNLTQLYN